MQAQTTMTKAWNIKDQLIENILICARKKLVCESSEMFLKLRYSFVYLFYGSLMVPTFIVSFYVLDEATDTLRSNLQGNVSFVHQSCIVWFSCK